jgi:hypothetical protein
LCVNTNTLVGRKYGGAREILAGTTKRLKGLEMFIENFNDADDNRQLCEKSLTQRADVEGRHFETFQIVNKRNIVSVAVN